MKKAFTLIELIVVIAVIGIMTTIVVMNYQAGEKSISLQREGIKFFQNVRRAQAILGEGWEDCKENDKYHDNYRFGYGLFFDLSNKNEYILFADCQGTKSYDEDNDKIVETIKLEKDIEILNLKVDDFLKDDFSVVFVLPEPEVHFEPDGDLVSVTFQIEDGSNSRTVTLNEIGLVEYENN